MNEFTVNLEIGLDFKLGDMVSSLSINSTLIIQFWWWQEQILLAAANTILHLCLKLSSEAVRVASVRVSWEAETERGDNVSQSEAASEEIPPIGGWLEAPGAWEVLKSPETVLRNSPQQCGARQWVRQLCRDRWLENSGKWQCGNTEGHSASDITQAHHNSGMISCSTAPRKFCSEVRIYKYIWSEVRTFQMIKTFRNSTRR